MHSILVKWKTRMSKNWFKGWILRMPHRKKISLQIFWKKTQIFFLHICVELLMILSQKALFQIFSNEPILLLYTRNRPEQKKIIIDLPVFYYPVPSLNFFCLSFHKVQMRDSEKSSALTRFDCHRACARKCKQT